MQLDKINFQTRPDIADYMAGMIPKDAISILEPTPGAGVLVNAIRKKGFSVVSPVDFFKMEMVPFDCIVMNPPFTPMKLGYDILFKCMEYTESIIALMPWLTIINGSIRCRKLQEFGLKSVTHLPRAAFPGSRVQTCIIELSRYHLGDTALKFYE